MMEQCKEKLSIAMFGQKRIPSREGGVEIVVEELCTRMVVHLFGNGLLAYIFTAVAVICGAVVFSVCAKWFLNKIETLIVNRS